MLVPSGNRVAETELRATLQGDVTMPVTRIALRDGSESEPMAMLPNLDGAAALPGHGEPDAIAFHCGTVSTFAPASPPRPGGRRSPLQMRRRVASRGLLRGLDQSSSNESGARGRRTTDGFVTGVPSGIA
jgi:hypothetical protein